MNSSLLIGERLPEPERWEILSDAQAMRLAIQEAFKGAGRTSPNPLVGCVVLDSKNRFLSKGFHEVWGGPHAEINALKELSDSEVKGAKVFVTLEPCAHEGRTPSCAKALARLPLQQVNFGIFDPNPLVAGEGAQILARAGIRVGSYVQHPVLDSLGVEYVLKSVSPDIQAEWNALLEQTCEHFLWNFRHQRPFFSVKVATSLDGQMAFKSGESKWITSEESRVYAHYLRAFHEATLVGSGTILTDNPQLNIRHPKYQDKQSKIIILDAQGRCLQKVEELQISKAHDPANIIFFVGDDFTNLELVKAKTSMGYKVEMIDSQNGLLNIDSVAAKIWNLGIKSVLVEGGARVISSFIRRSLAQRLYLFSAPIIMGAKNGRSWTEDLDLHSMEQRIQLKWQKTVDFGEDHLFSGRF